MHNTWYALSASAVAAIDAAGVPVVMTLHNYRLMCANALLFRDGRPCEDCVGTSPWHGVRHRCYRGSLLASAAAAGSIAANTAFKTWHRHVRLFLALNEFTRGRYIHGGFPTDKIRVKPNFAPDPGLRERPPSASRTVLFVGRLSRQKGLEVVLDAWRTLGEDLQLLVVGDGPLRAELEGASPPSVRFRGQVPPDEVERLMLRSRALVFPSLSYEGQPMVVLQALASGLPVLASRLGGNPALLAPAGERWLSAPGDPSAWACGLRELLDDDEVDRAGARLRQRYEDRFSEQIGRRLLEDAYLTARGRVA